MDALPTLTSAQVDLADTRARCSIAAADASAAAQPHGFISIRDTRATAKQCGTEVPNYAAEKHMIRDAGFGRLKTGVLLGEWESIVNATYEAARFHGEPIDLFAVSRLALAWCLADRPGGHPVKALARLARDIATDDVHNETLRPSYRQLLDGWRLLLAP